LDGIERYNDYLHLNTTFLSEKEDSRGTYYPMHMLLRKYEHFRNWASEEFIEDIRTIARFGSNATKYNNYLNSCHSRAGRLFGHEAAGMLQDRSGNIQAMLVNNLELFVAHQEGRISSKKLCSFVRLFLLECYREESLAKAHGILHTMQLSLHDPAKI
jgi:hypothetical protein